MATAKKKMVTGVFRNRTDAENVHDWLLSAGYSPSDINVLMTEKTRGAYLPRSEKGEKLKSGTHAAEGMGVGGAVGTAIGATLGALVAIGTSVVIPGIGLVVAGPIAAALAGGGAGAVTGGVIGGLVGLGIPESNAKAYEAALRDGGVVIGVVPKTSADASRIETEFEEQHGENVCYG